MKTNICEHQIPLLMYTNFSFLMFIDYCVHRFFLYREHDQSPDTASRPPLSSPCSCSLSVTVLTSAPSFPAGLPYILLLFLPPPPHHTPCSPLPSEEAGHGGGHGGGGHQGRRGRVQGAGQSLHKYLIEHDNFRPYVCPYVRPWVLKRCGM